MVVDQRTLLLAVLLALTSGLSHFCTSAHAGAMTDQPGHRTLELAQAEAQAQAEQAVERALMSEHAARIVSDLQASGRSRDAGLALMLRPLTARLSRESFDLWRASSDAVEASWQALFDDLDGVPPSLLHALAAQARRYADAAQWERYEAALLRRDVRNLASWLHRIPTLRDNPPALDAWLRRAAQHVDSYDSLSFEPVVLMAEALAKRPLQPDLAELLRMELASGFALLAPGTQQDEMAAASRASDRELWSTMVLGVHMAVALPTLGDIAMACSVEETQLRRVRREVCLSLIRRALPGAGNLLEHGLLTNMWQRLAADTPEEAEATMQRRISLWQRHHGLTAVTGAADVAVWFDYLSAPGANEMGWVRQRMLEFGIALTPPEDWRPTGSYSDQD